MQEVILVNRKDEELGREEKMKAHREGLLHRAFSIFIFNPQGQMLLQQRNKGKYHSGGLWTNACCSHPNPGEDLESAASRRLQEEMGFHTPLVKVFDFIYEAGMENGLTEHEYDHVFVGEYAGTVAFNRDEVMDFCYKTMDDLKQSLAFRPQAYTAWFRLAFPKVESWWQERYKTNN